MPDLLAGTTVLAADTPAAQFVTEATDETGFTSTTYTPGTTTCGLTFVAPTTGRVELTWYARFESNSAGVEAAVSAAVRTGGTIGSGTSVLAANDGRSLMSEARIGAGMAYTLTGLTAGSTYNAQIEFRMTAAGNGDIFDRSLGVKPLP